MFLIFCNDKYNRSYILCRGGGIPLYKLYRYLPPHRVGFSRRFGLKTGIHFTHFDLESGIFFFGGNYGIV